MAVRGLKTKIAVNIALLLLVSAILTGVVIILITQGVMMRTYLDRQQKILVGLGPILIDLSTAESESTIPTITPSIATLLGRLDVSAALWADDSGKKCFEYGPSAEQHQMLPQVVRNAIRQATPQRKYLGLKWAVIWWHAETAVVAGPIRRGNKIIGACGAVLPLAPVISRLRAYNLPIVLYILFNTAILTIVGFYRIFHLYLRPIERMVNQAETYGDDEDFFFTFRREDNELNRLSKSLNRMLGRIAADRQTLQENVTSLAQANTDLKKAQNDIIHAEKMASIGRLAAGVAHEIGNPIGIVLGYLDLLKQRDLDPADREDFLRRSEMEIQRINKVIRQLLDLARPRPSLPEELSVNVIIQDFIAGINAQPILSDIQIKTGLQAERDKIFGDSDQLRQVLLNIIINAADAIHESTGNAGGAIIISTANTNGPQPSRDTWVTIEIHDNGPGIAPEQLSNIFDPFFSTKEPGKGTGLGLAVSYTIMEKMGGTITVQSRTDEGTTFTLKMPLAVG